MADRRAVTSSTSVSPVELAHWRARAVAAGVSLSAPLRQAVAHARTWTAPAAAVERRAWAAGAGMATVGTTASDPEGLSATLTTEVTVVQPNRPPEAGADIQPMTAGASTGWYPVAAGGRGSVLHGSRW